MKWKLQFIAMFLAFFGIAVAAAFDNGPVVKLPEYTAHGYQDTTKKGNSAHLFLGIPFAKKPERFEKPEPLPSSSTRIIEAKDWPLACHQVIDVSFWNITVDEDCLKLNVFTPTTAESSSKKLPVFIFIHGGGFDYGATKEYGWEYFVDNFISRDIIMITLQYRLAHYGYLATEDGVINGNFGHFDQIEALKFIKRNIAAFGGDPNRITLSGHSAGSISVHAISLSPHSRGLYNQEIHIASSNYAQWPIDTQFVLDHSTLISNAVGCKQTNTTARKACLKLVKPKKFWNVRKKLKLTDFPYATRDVLYWTTVYDKDLFDGKKVDELQKVAPKRNCLYGVDAGEGVLFTIYTDNNITNVFSVGRSFTPADRHKANETDIIKYLKQIMSDPAIFTPKVQDEVIAKIFKFYKIGKQYAGGDPLYFWDRLSELYTDMVMKMPHNLEVNAKLDYGFKNQYMYVFNYVRPQDRPVMGNLPGHGYFLMYFAGLELYNTVGINQTKVDLKIQDNMAQMFESFVKTGIPQSNKIKIPEITSKHILPYMELNEGVVLGDSQFTPKTVFWQELNEKYKYDLIRGFRLNK